MSYTEIYIIRKNGDVEHYADIQNAHRGAMFIWIKLKGFYDVQEDSCISWEKTWKLYCSGKLERFEDITLGTTFDNVMVAKKDLLSVALAFDKFYEKYNGGSLKEQAMILKNIYEEEDCLGICWNQTSVNGDTWQYYPACEHEEERSFNIHKDKNEGGEAWWLFQQENPELLSQ